MQILASHLSWHRSLRISSPSTTFWSTLITIVASIVALIKMPTTRSQGRSEPLLHLQTPPKRQRKRNPRRPLLAQTFSHQEPVFRTLSLSPEPQRPIREKTFSCASTQTYTVSYSHAATQTEEVVILTDHELAEMRDRAVASVSNKRTRDDESEDEPTAKRYQFSTPQNSKSNNLWMFGERANGDHPRTAPSKSLNGASIRRPIRGPLSKRSNLAPNSRFKIRASALEGRDDAFENIKPIEESTDKADTHLDEDQQEEESITSTEQQQPANIPLTPRRGLFGSIRGIVNRGWDLAASFTPRGGRNDPVPDGQSTSTLNQIAYPQLGSAPEPESSLYSLPTHEHYDVSDSVSHPQRHISESPQPSSRYDHLHYIPADATSVEKAINREIEPPPRAVTPPSPASRMRAQNPQLSEATIESMLKKRERKAALDEEKYGPRQTPETTKIAPLFGPDSHYARGTVDPRFVPSSSLYGSGKKRKLESVNGQIPRPKSGGFGIDDDYLDIDVEIDSVDSPDMSGPMDGDGRPVKRHKAQDTTLPASAIPATPRSALKKPGIPSSIGRKSVAFGQSFSRDIRGHYGPAGQYKGSTFADDFPDDSRSMSSIDANDVLSPTTRLNTVANSSKKSLGVHSNIGASIPAIDFTLRDPNDQSWRPSLGNPRPGVFRVPDVDEEDPDESMSDVPIEQPQTPRMSHAELPAAPNTNGSVSFNESSIVHESTELALDKARSKAEKYKPKSSSRLSEVSRARSRSTSPDNEEDRQSPEKDKTTMEITAPAVRPVGAPPQPFVAPELDNTIKGADGMTAHEREHQYDDWAAQLKWDAPQTYEDAGTGSAFIHNLIRKNWTEEDDRRSEAFWAREFDEVDRAMEEAKAQGQRLTLITGMEEIEGY